MAAIHIACILCWISLLCSLFLTLVYWRLGYRFRLLTFLSLSLALQHSQKIYLITAKCILRPQFYRPTLFSSILILINAFAVAAYNLSLIMICVHIYLLIQAAGTGYDHIKAQEKFVQGISLVSFIQLIHVAAYNRGSLTRIEVLPYLWIQNVVLLLQVVICPVLIIHLLVKCHRARERTFEFLRKSSISSSLMWRLMIALIGLVVLSSYSLYLQVTSSLKTGSGGRFKAFNMWEATAEQLAFRYRVGSIVGPVLMIIFLTAQEPSDYVREKWLAVSEKVTCKMRRRRKSSVPWLDQETGVASDVRFTGRDSMDTQLGTRCDYFGSQVSSDPSSLDPKDSARLDSIDISLPGKLRRMSEMARPETPSKINRSVSMAADIKPGRSDSLPEIVCIKGKDSI